MTNLVSNVYYHHEEVYILAYEDEGEEVREREYFTNAVDFYHTLAQYEQMYNRVEFMTESYCLTHDIGYPGGDEDEINDRC